MVQPLFGDDKAKSPKPTLDLQKPVVLEGELQVAGAGKNAPTVAQQQSASMQLTVLPVDDNYIDTLGMDSSKTLPALSSRLAEKAKASDLEGFGIHIGKLITTAKGWAPSEKPKGLISSVMGLFSSAKEEAKDHYRSVEERIKDLMTELNTIAQTQRETFTDLQSMIVQAGEQSRKMSIDIDESSQRLDLLRERLQELSALDPSQNHDLPRLLQEGNRLENRLARKVRDLDAARTVLAQTGVMMQTMCDTAIGIVDKFNMIEQVSISIWRNQFTIYIASQSQKKAIDVFDMVDEATNKALIENAKTTRSNALRVEQANNRGVVSREAVQQVTDEMVGMLNDLKNESDTARVRQLEDMKSFEKNRQTLHSALKGKA